MKKEDREEYSKKELKDMINEPDTIKHLRYVGSLNEDFLSKFGFKNDCTYLKWYIASFESNLRDVKTSLVIQCENRDFFILDEKYLDYFEEAKELLKLLKDSGLVVEKELKKYIFTYHCGYHGGGRLKYDIAYCENDEEFERYLEYPFNLKSYDGYIPKVERYNSVTKEELIEETIKELGLNSEDLKDIRLSALESICNISKVSLQDVITYLKERGNK